MPRNRCAHSGAAILRRPGPGVGTLGLCAVTAGIAVAAIALAGIALTWAHTASPPDEAELRPVTVAAFSVHQAAPPPRLDRVGPAPSAALAADPATEPGLHLFAGSLGAPATRFAPAAPVAAFYARFVRRDAAPRQPLPLQARAQPRLRLASLPPSGPSSLSPETMARTAVYDISARVVYLPNGEKLEAHSGLGALMDDPRHVHVKMRGATPPNSYRLTLREKLFHGVQAIRLTPEDQGAMFGRAGILAHTYMLGPNGQSNGCVSLKNYPRFLNAFLRGEIDRIVVVARLPEPPSVLARAE